MPFPSRWHAFLFLTLWVAHGSLPDHYSVLSVSHDATQKEIKKAFRQLALQWHPDKQQNATHKALAADRMRELNEAYGILSNEEKRAAYDKLVAKIGRFGEWYHGHDSSESQGVDLPDWVLAYFACPAYAEYKYGFLFSLVFCTGFLGSHVIIGFALFFLYKWMTWGPIRPTAAPLWVLWTVMKMSLVIAMGLLAVLMIILTLSYGEALYFLCLATFIPLALGYLVLSKLVPKKTLEAAERYPSILWGHFLKCLRRCDTNPICVKTTSGTVRVGAREAEAIRQQQKVKEDGDAKEAKREENSREAERRSRKKAAKMQSIPMKVADIAPLPFQPAAPSPPTPEPSNPKESNPDDNVWTKDQQNALQKALRKYPTGTEARWDKIEKEVPGKSKKQCIERFQALANMAAKSEVDAFVPAADSSKKNRKK